MAHYVMSDIHGEAEVFRGMLERIGFSDADTLYILGDVVDRGPDGIALLREILETPNMKLILGNHDHMMMRFFSPDVTQAEIRRWDKNRNADTKEGFRKLSADRQRELLDVLKNLPSHLELEVEGRKFYLVHGFPGENQHDEVWFRPEIDTPNPIPGTSVIIGHTPVQYLTHPEDDARHAYLDELESRGEHLHILHTPGFIDIDCSCGYQRTCKALACLRLEDMKEFYQFPSSV